MKVSHRGHEITVERQTCLGGYELMYWSIFRENDLWECDSGYTEDSSTVPEYVELLKQRVDAELSEDDPWMEKEGLT